MKFVDEFRNSELGQAVIGRIKRLSTKNIRLMEFCGGHTVSIFRYGIRELLPSTIEMLSGPGCPVCVTSIADIDRAIALSRIPDAITTTFGDMLRVPGSYSSLQCAKAEGADIRIVYSTMDALNIAKANPQRPVFFIGIGFETTAPTIAASILEAERLNIKNYFILSLHKLCPPVIKALLDSGEVKLDGLICPGHVSAIIGSQPWEFIPASYGIGCVVSGFEPLDILLCVEMLVKQMEKDKASVEIAYRRGVKREGNTVALKMMNQVFEECTADWRGIGKIAGSGLRIRGNYKKFDAEQNFEIVTGLPREPHGCICGDILRGVKTPANCKLFRNVCSPDNPIGPCMVSSEGSCAAYYHYGGVND